MTGVYFVNSTAAAAALLGFVALGGCTSTTVKIAALDVSPNAEITPDATTDVRPRIEALEVSGTQHLDFILKAQSYSCHKVDFTVAFADGARETIEAAVKRQFPGSLQQNRRSIDRSTARMTARIHDFRTELDCTSTYCIMKSSLRLDVAVVGPDGKKAVRRALGYGAAMSEKESPLCIRHAPVIQESLEKSLRMAVSSALRDLKF